VPQVEDDPGELPASLSRMRIQGLAQIRVGTVWKLFTFT